MKAAGAKRASIFPNEWSIPFSLNATCARKTSCSYNENRNLEKQPIPVYQNITTTAVTNPDEIKKILIAQLNT